MFVYRLAATGTTGTIGGLAAAYILVIEEYEY